MKNETTILFDSPEAASFKTNIEGWVSAKGHFYGKDERAARYDGCTHKKCEVCGEQLAKTSWCKPCHDKKRQEKFQSFPVEVWDGVTPLAIFDSDTFFCDEDELLDYLCGEEIDAGKIQLVWCKGVKPSALTANEMFEDELAEDCDVEDGDILAAVDALNAAIDKAKPFSWWAIDKRADISKIIKSIDSQEQPK